ncbi:trihelix transcription factor ASIL2-like [Pistacia vera]|uniref:trihelix transcription factor ASIL2-like n=1 Tax=Pistacia vera TaxID=55513 RepID=UPI001263A6EB|nr:trihelix transcription factor ASIL2-like [Pistacia vera]
MDKETNQEPTPSLLLPNNKEDSPKKPFTPSNDRLKRDEWSEGAVSTLLEAYENKWVLRNRAKLKGHDWEEVARHVSLRANNTKSPKTQTQCKNKIESMKKRYRSESANADGSSWLLYPRLDLLLRGSAQPQPQPQPQPLQQQQTQPVNPPLMLLEPSPQLVPPPAAAPPQGVPAATGTTQNSHGSIGVDRIGKEDGVETKISDHLSDKKAMETDSSTPALYSHDKEKLTAKKLKMKMEKKKRRKREEWEIAESIRWLAEVVVRSEQARMETMREIEKMRVEAEAKRGEMDLKRTEIIANTQLEIAKLFASTNGKGVDSSLRIGRN